MKTTSELIKYCEEVIDYCEKNYENKGGRECFQEIIQRLMEFDELKSVIHDTLDTAIELYSLLFALTGEFE